MYLLTYRSDGPGERDYHRNVSFSRNFDYLPGYVITPSLNIAKIAKIIISLVNSKVIYYFLKKNIVLSARLNILIFLPILG